MNKSKLKTYAPQARRDFITAVSARAALLGLPPDEKTKVEVSGDVAIINGQAYPRNIAKLRERLLQRIKAEGWNQFVEEIAYTWFNRFTALRFMELNGFLPHGLRVLSNPDESKDEPEILEKAHTVDLPGLAHESVVDLKLATNKEAELYRLLLVAQCNQLHAAMPFLFERINDETELLLPDNLLHSDSVIRKLVHEIDEEDWREVEIIGWLYQFYISERKDEVIGKVVKSEDIPAATQLFTPNWIVKYMAQNSLGRMWLQTYPDSGLRAKMEYYIEPAEQSEEVRKELAKLTPASINPEEIKILDPACGSGHILVEAYDLLKEIYLERGYSGRDIPRLILEKNLYGLDIDERAAQLASFAVLMKARADERRIMGNNAPRLNIMAIPESSHLNTKELTAALLTKTEPTRAVPIRDEAALFADAKSQPSLAIAEEPQTQAHDKGDDVNRNEVMKLLEVFEQGKTLGSLIEISAELGSTVLTLERIVSAKLTSTELMERTAAEQIAPFMRAAKILAQQYDCVIANPPYMGSKYLNPYLKKYLKDNFVGFEKDLFSSFIVRNLQLTRQTGQLGFMSPFVWMFISSYEDLRTKLIDEHTLATLIQLEYSGFDGATVPVCTFTVSKVHLRDYVGSYVRLSDFRGAQNQAPRASEAIRNRACGWFHNAKPDDFKRIPGNPIAYWVSQNFLSIFSKSRPMCNFAEPRKGMVTADNTRYIRSWSEVSINQIGFDIGSREESVLSKARWFPYQKGGDYRNWYGNHDWVVDWQDDGRRLLNMQIEGYKVGSTNHNLEYIFKPSLIFSKITSTKPCFRISPKGFLFDDASGLSPVINPRDEKRVLGFMCSEVCYYIGKVINPTLNIQPGNMAVMPIIFPESSVEPLVESAISLSKADWDSFETSWDFQTFPFLHHEIKGATVSESFANWERRNNASIERMKKLETENNRIFIEAYGLQDELSPEVSAERITLASADSSADTRRLVSYALGCMMGRYSLDEPGLIYAHSGGAGFDPSRYRTLAADEDGIVPITDLEWFDDDAANRVSKFVVCAWGDDTCAQNLKWIAEQLSAKAGETPVETIRRYLSAQFFKDHLQTYKRRPIYWLFSSGKQKAFECLVYLHRYNESTLSRMRNEYVTPLFGKLSARIEYVGGENGDGGQIGVAGSAAEKNKLRKQLDALKKKHTELVAFDEQLRHYADMRIKLDLDDGVKVNYGKFGNLLAEVRTVTGGSAE